MVSQETYSYVRDWLSRFIYRPDCALLFSASDSMEIKLNATAIAFYHSILSNSTLSDAAKELQRKYDVKYSVIESDLVNFIEKIFQQNKKDGHKVFHNTQVEKSFSLSMIKSPFAVEIELTRTCNFKCPFCYNTWKYNDSDSPDIHLRKEAIFRILNQASELDNRVLKIRYSGGEPTLYPYLNDVIEAGASFGFFQSIFTNAFMLDDSAIALWRKNNVNEVLISLHGTSESHDAITQVRGSFERACCNIRSILSAGIDVVVEMTLVSSNLNDIDVLIDTVVNLGVTELRIMKYVKNGVRDLDNRLSVSDEEFESVRDYVRTNDYYKKHALNIFFPCSQKFCKQGNEILNTDDSGMLLDNCRAGINWIAISYNGEVKICPHSTQSYGNVYDSNFSLIDVWRNGTSKASASIIQSREASCSKCRMWTKCYGGCLIRG